MLKKFYFSLLTMLLIGSGFASAQTLLSEGFESTKSDKATFDMPDGWTVVTAYTGTTLGYKWTVGHNSTSGSTMTGLYYVYLNPPTYDDGSGDGLGPRKDYLITPELDLDNTYQLSFDWEAAAYAVLSQQQNTFQVAIIDMSAPSDTTVIFDIQNEEQVRNSGVPKDQYGTYMWGNWEIHTSKIDLSEYKGKKIKIAFIYYLQKKYANIVYLDNISVVQHDPITSPIAQVSQTSYKFPTMYITEKFYSEQITLKNVGTAGLKVTGFEAPDCIGLSMDTTVSLGYNETAKFQLWYKASLTSPTSADVVLKTNGGDVTINVTATKEAIPDGYTLELFEGNSFPPAGWTNDGWGSTAIALEGDASAYGTGNLSHTYLTTPRIDLSNANAPHSVVFSYYAMYDSEDNYYPGNDLSLWISQDGGVTYDSIWVADYTKTDTLFRITVDLSKYTSDNCYLRFKNSAVYFDTEYGADDWATYFLDRILLPNVYGTGGVPFASELISPADSATNVYTKNITFSWTEAQFATGYRLYIGTSKNNWNVLNGYDCGAETSYVLAAAQPATTYYWKVVPYNSVGNATDVPIWMFTTQEDQTVKSFPWSEEFENSTFAPLGWSAEGTSLTKWSRTDYYPFEGDACAMAFSNETEVTATLTSPDIMLPADGDGLTLSFWWGNERPVSLVIDNSAVHTNNSTKEDGIDAVFFDIWDGSEWKQVTLISDNAESDGNRYWCYEQFDLSEYAGKTIALRWRYISHNYNRSRGASLDNVKISGNAASVTFNTSGWDAYKVNYGAVETSESFAVTNLGSQAVNIDKVSFGTPYFSTTLKDGTSLDAADSQQFTISFTAALNSDDSLIITDEMKLELSDGSSLTLPLRAIALAPDMLYYGFEHDATGEVPNEWTGIDVDGAVTSPLTWWTTPNVGKMPMSFFVLNDSECYNSLKEPHGHQSLMTRCNTDCAFDDWVVSKQVPAGKKTTFSLDTRNWEAVNSVLPAGTPTIKVWVSTTSATDRTTFTQVGSDKTLALFDNKAWTHLEYDLSSYAGENIYVGVEAVSTNCIGAFYDNFEFAHLNILVGDVNGDGEVNIADVNAIISIILGNSTAADYSGVSDVNADGEINIADANAIIAIILGNEDKE